MPHQETLVKQKVKTFLRYRGVDKQVKRTKEKYENLIRNIPDAIYFALPGETGEATFISGRWKDWTGYSPDDFHGDFEILPKSIHPEDKDKTIQAYTQAHKEKKEYVFEYRVVHKDTGEVRYLRDHGVPVKNEKGEILRFSGIITDITERKQTEEELRNASLYSRGLIETSLDPLVTISQDGKITDINKATEDITGLSRKQLIGKDFSDYFTEPDKAREGYKKVLSEGFVRNYPLTVKHLNGKITSVLCNATVYTNEKGELQGVFAAARDIAERRQTEENIRKQDALLKAINTVLTETLVCETDEEVARTCLAAAQEVTGSKFGLICEVNKAGRFDTIAISDPGWDACKIPKADAVLMVNGTKIRGIRGRVIKDECSIIINNPAASHPDWIEPPEGHPRITCFLGVPLKRKGKTFGIIGLANKESGYEVGDQIAIESLAVAFVEALHRKRAEEILAASETRYRRLFETAKDGILVLDADTGEISDVNPFLVQILGYAREQFLGRRLWDIGPFRNVEACKVAFTKLQTEGYIRYEDLALETKDGQRIDVEFVSNVYRVNREKVIQCHIRDVTERKRVEEERKRLNAELARKNKELEQIVHIISHDLRSPLVNVQGFSKELDSSLKELFSVIQSEGVPADVREKIAFLVEEDIPESIQYILNSASQMDSLLSGLLRLSYSASATIKMEELDMNALISNVVKTFEFHIKKAGVNLEIHELPPCKGDKIHISQVFSNLLDNALKYFHPDRPGIIRISGHKEKDKSVYCVEDNGIGIAPEHQGKIFEIFHQLNPVTSTGEGLGLTIVSRILDRQNGKIWVESELGKGSKFFVSLPGV
jgi:PAS domain S-box-containing protein